MENLFGGLVTLENKESYHEFINTLDNSSALQIIELAVAHVQSTGAFNLRESHCLYECLKKLNTKD